MTGNQWDVEQSDVSIAYVNANLDEDGFIGTIFHQTTRRKRKAWPKRTETGLQTQEKLVWVKTSGEIVEFKLGGMITVTWFQTI